MCSVSGVILLEGADYREVERRLARILVKAEDRGRDSFGVVAVNRDGSVNVVKSLGRPSTQEEKLRGILSEDAFVVVANNRAEPTTEYVRQKTQEDIQPFVGERYIVTHNGIIANDQELEAKYKLTRKTKIDSAVIPPLLDKTWDGSLEGLRKLLSEVKGSFAFIIADRKRPDRIFIA
ncbi:MAG: 7-cyano-7-deazaguanine synthase, partial [Candidatus Aramenus sp.]|nr:7-cyano-7-deazaguanine synthase [Candidatus Aramenus sp.]